VQTGGDTFIGPAGWSYEDWKGTVYPHPPPPKFDPLVYLSRFFDLIEVNSTFYRPPTRGIAESWARRVRERERFRFTVKAFKEFTHGERGSVGRSDAHAFLHALKPLYGEGRLGAVLFQFPHWFTDGPENRARLKSLREWFDGPTPLNMEIRHTSWLHREPMTFLHDLGLGFVNIDLPQARTSPPPTAFATTDTGYVRLHGRNSAAWFNRTAGRDQKYDYHYGREELEEWIRQVKTLNGKTTVTYLVTNNHFRGQAPANALEIMARIADRKIPLPRALAGAYPELREVGEIEDWKSGQAGFP
jgi:uncharacterized protein YecE (DUF72 family)